MDLKRKFFYKSVGFFYLTIFIQSKLTPDCQTIFETAHFVLLSALFLIALILELYLVDPRFRILIYGHFCSSLGNRVFTSSVLGLILFCCYCCWFVPEPLGREWACRWVEYWVFFEGPVGIWYTLRRAAWTVFYQPYRFYFGEHTVLDIAYWRTLAFFIPEHRKLRYVFLNWYFIHRPAVWRRTTPFLYGVSFVLLGWFFLYYKYYFKTYSRSERRETVRFNLILWLVVIYFIFYL